MAEEKDIENPVCVKDTHFSKGYRREEKWTEAHENLCKEWLEEAQEASKNHNKSGLSNKFKHVIFGLPTVLIPAIFSPVSIALEGEESLPYVSMTGFILTGIFGGIDQFFDYSGKHQRHMDFSARYADVVSDIKFELAQGRQFRTDADQFLMRIQKTMDSNGANAPDL